MAAGQSDKGIDDTLVLIASNLAEAESALQVTTLIHGGVVFDLWGEAGLW